MGRRKIRRGPGQRQIGGKDFRLADEIRYIQLRAAAYDGRFVTVGPLALFSTDTGDAWLLDPADHLAARLAQDAIPSRSTLRKAMPTSPSAGRATTPSMAIYSSSLTTTRPALSPSSAIRPTASLDWDDLKISNMFG